MGLGDLVGQATLRAGGQWTRALPHLHCTALLLHALTRDVRRAVVPRAPPHPVRAPATYLLHDFIVPFAQQLQEPQEDFHVVKIHHLQKRCATRDGTVHEGGGGGGDRLDHGLCMRGGMP